VTAAAAAAAGVVVDASSAVVWHFAELLLQCFEIAAAPSSLSQQQQQQQCVSLSVPLLRYIASLQQHGDGVFAAALAVLKQLRLLQNSAEGSSL
jgi:hypothetical protein